MSLVPVVVVVGPGSNVDLANVGLVSDYSPWWAIPVAYYIPRVSSVGSGPGGISCGCWVESQERNVFYNMENVPRTLPLYKWKTLPTSNGK